ncbi:uncharacterized protein K02A2.6-like [Anopheles merus]|uniref:uncharacterized protein K02A2.6-like n=1 Tax=Anopheles merus TaxID=30066 RepID=UPI001BE490ED|nr:uncharacterized protein K02A2.6-like [Anopheles merus]
MDETLSGCEGTIWYLDDVLIEGQNLQEHDKRLNKVLSRLKNRGIELNWEKCQLRVSDIEFLGHSLNQEGIMPSRNKLELFYRSVNRDVKQKFMQEMRPVPMLLCDKIETAKLATEWKIWKEALECYFAAYNVTDQTEKKANYYISEDRHYRECLKI